MHKFDRFTLYLFIIFGLHQLPGQEPGTEVFPISSKFALEEINAGNPTYYGLAGYYNRIEFYLANAGGHSEVDISEAITLKKGEYLVSIGRFRAFVIEGKGALVVLADQSITIMSSSFEDPAIKRYFLDRSDLDAISPGLSKLRYKKLWWGFASLAWGVEWLLVLIQSTGIFSWGIAILTLALVLKIFLLPLSMLTLNAQRKVSALKTQLEPKLSAIRANYKGEEAHNRIIAAHKELGISPLFTLRPLFATLIQIPVLIAVFNALGEMPQIQGNSFLWIDDLSFPDFVTQLPLTIPFLGNTLNLLPILMTVVSVTSTLLFRNREAPANEVKKQKRNLFVMSAAFLILLYPFPASMVLYWTASNALHIIQQRILGS